MWKYLYDSTGTHTHTHSHTKNVEVRKCIYNKGFRDKTDLTVCLWARQPIVTKKFVFKN